MAHQQQLSWLDLVTMRLSYEMMPWGKVHVSHYGDHMLPPTAQILVSFIPTSNWRRRNCVCDVIFAKRMWLCSELLVCVKDWQITIYPIRVFLVLCVSFSRSFGKSYWSMLTSQTARTRESKLNSPRSDAKRSCRHLFNVESLVAWKLMSMF